MADVSTSAILHFYSALVYLKNIFLTHLFPHSATYTLPAASVQIDRFPRKHR